MLLLAPFAFGEVIVRDRSGRIIERRDTVTYPQSKADIKKYGLRRKVTRSYTPDKKLVKTLTNRGNMVVVKDKYGVFKRIERGPRGSR